LYLNYGLSIHFNLCLLELGGNPYVNFVISAAVEIPAYIIVLLILNRFGRKIPLSVFLIFAGKKQFIGLSLGI